MGLLLKEDANIGETMIEVTQKTYDRKLQQLINLVEEKNIDLPGKYQGETHFINMKDVCYIESVSVLPNYKLEAKLLNLEKLVINRHYTKNIKAYLNI